MMNVKQTVKGLSLLLCLGFLVSTGNAVAQTNTLSCSSSEEAVTKAKNDLAACKKKSTDCSMEEKDLESAVKNLGTCQRNLAASAAASASTSASSSTNAGSPIDTKKIKIDKIEKEIANNSESLFKDLTNLELNCAAGDRALSDYKSKANDYKSKAEASNNAIDSVVNACNKFSGIKSEYNSCLGGGKGVDVSAARQARSAASSAEKAMNDALNIAKNAIKSCKATAKDDASADKDAAKADKKADKAKEKLAKEAESCSQQEIENGTCAAKYETMYNNCGDDARACKEAYNKWQDVKKLEEKYQDKAGVANNMQAAAEDAELAKLSTQCGSGEEWSRAQNGGQGGCVPKGAKDEDIKACGGSGFFRDSDGNCYGSKSDRDAAVQAKKDKAKEEAQAAAEASKAAEQAYNDCVAQNGLEPEKCAAEWNAMNDAIGDAYKAEMNLGELGESLDTSVDNSIKAEAQAAAGGRKTICEKELSTMDGLFSYLACRITVLVADIRIIVYILAGFGMIAFAYGAIIGKINFKQLANIGIGLFILSMTTSVIEYIAFDGKQDLKFRDYLPDGNHAQFDVTRQNCDNNPSLCPDAQLAGLKADAESSKWSLSDLKNTIRSVKDGLKTASDAYSTVKSTVKTVSTAAENIGNAIAHGDNIIDSLTTITSNMGNAMNTINNSTNIVADSASRIAGDVQDAGSSAAQRQYREALRSEYNTLSQRCANGGCSEAEQKSLANLQEEINKNTTGVDNFLATTGGDILNDLQNVTNMATTGAEVGRAVNQAQIEGNAIGENIGGGALGDILGATYAATEGYTSGSDAVDTLKENGSFDFSSEKTKCDNLGQPYAWQNNTCVDTCKAKTTLKETYAWDKNTQSCVNKTQANCEARSTANRKYKWNTSTKKCEEVTSK